MFSPMPKMEEALGQGQPAEKLQYPEEEGSGLHWGVLCALPPRRDLVTTAVPSWANPWTRGGEGGWELEGGNMHQLGTDP